MKITAKFGGQCRECQREIHAGDEIEWVHGEGATHLACALGGFPPLDRRIGTAATAKPLDLPHYPESEESVEWADYRPKDPHS